MYAFDSLGHRFQLGRLIDDYQHVIFATAPMNQRFHQPMVRMIKLHI